MVTKLNSLTSSLNKEMNRAKNPLWYEKGKQKLWGKKKKTSRFSIYDLRLVLFSPKVKPLPREKCYAQKPAKKKQTPWGVDRYREERRRLPGADSEGKQLPTGKSHRVLFSLPQADDWLRRQGSAQHAHADRRHGVLSSLRRTCCRHEAEPAWRRRRWPRCY